MSETVDSLKQRLVGAFVILSLAIIFLPMIFDKPHNDGRSLLVPVPPKPEYKTIEIATPVQPEFKVLELDSKSNKVVEGENTLVASSSPKSVKEPKPVTAEPKKVKPKIIAKKTGSLKQENKAAKQVNKRPKASQAKVSHLPVFKNIWMVQLGTFSNSKNAYRLRDKLRGDGFDAHTKEVKLGGKKAIRVFTGPFVKKREAAKTKMKLDQKYKVESQLIFFDA